ncbi:MAG: ATP-binding protein [Nanoarchaeota archaeon]
MNIEQIREYLIDFQKKELPIMIERELKIDTSKKIKSLIGPRRAGKTTFMYQKMHELIKAGVKKENIIYLNFEDTRLIEINFKEIREIIKIHWQIFPESTKKEIHVFIDEPQNIEYWENAVRSLHDDGFDIYLTGSSSKLLSREIATSLRGRTLSYLLLPFSFNEFLKMKKYKDNINLLDSKEKSILLSLLEEYLEFGGFPEIILEQDKEKKLKIINEYFSLIVYRDIIERYKLKNTLLVKWIIKALSSSFSNEFSVNKLFLTLKSQGFRVSKNTLYSYVSILEDSLFSFMHPKFNYAIRNKKFSINKAYLCDTAFVKLVENSRDIGRKMENMVFLQLERRKGSLTTISYWKNTQGEEVDFVIKEGVNIKQLIQVSYNISDSETKKREIRSLLRASKELKCNNLIVITWDYEKIEEISWFGIKRKVHFVPVWKWLLKTT